MTGLTARQLAILDFIKGYIVAHEYPPAWRDIAAHFGFVSVHAVHDHLRALERKGFIRMPASKASRALVVLNWRPRRAPTHEFIPVTVCDRGHTRILGVATCPQCRRRVAA